MTSTMPATRVDNDVIFEGGHARRLTRAERLLLWLGVKNTVKNTSPPRGSAADYYERLRDRYAR